MSRRANETRLVFSLVLHCCLSCWSVVGWGYIATDDGNKIFWGWWGQQTTTTQPYTTSPQITNISNNLADEGYLEPNITITISAENTTLTEPSTTTELEQGSTVNEPTTTTTSSTTEALASTTELSPLDVTTTTESTATTCPVTTTEPTSTSQSSSVGLSEELPSKYRVYWNVPSFQCHKYGLNFSRVSDWGLQQNPGDEFRGEVLAILYDPGEFPALLPASGDRKVSRNGGVPQEGDLGRHLTLFAQHLDKLIPDPHFSGMGIIDFEHWRPVWRQNWGSLAPYRDFSRHIERRRHPYWFSSIIESEATFRFQLAGRAFMLETLRMAKRLRPFAKWGYYGYPFCFNYTPNNNKPNCSEETRRDNDEMSWMFNEETSHYPSLYLKEQDMYPWKRRRFVDGRLTESMRMAKKVPVYPYVWYKYHDTNKFLTEEDMKSVLRRPLGRGCRGVVIWGASRDVNTRAKCFALADYLEKVIGPAVLEVTSEGWRERYGQDENTTPLAEEEEVLGEEDPEYHDNVPYVH